MDFLGTHYFTIDSICMRFLCIKIRMILLKVLNYEISEFSDSLGKNGRFHK